MTTEQDRQGIVALYGPLGDDVPGVAPLIFHGLLREMASQFPEVDVDLTFDDGPWAGLPSLAELLPLEEQIHVLAVSAHGGGEDLPRFLAAQRDLADRELAWKRERVVVDGSEAGVDGGGVGAASAVVSVDAGGGGGDFSGGLEDGVAVVAGGVVAVRPHAGKAPKVSGKRGARKVG